jgi:galactonate dehydratase
VVRLERAGIATLAESYDVQPAPHCPLGPVALAACVQLDLAVLVPVAGHIPCPTGPGSGIEVDEDAMRAAAVAHPPVPVGNPRWTYPDGGLAEW